jgi:GNAT superfamily N-acetyltransferase
MAEQNKRHMSLNIKDIKRQLKTHPSLFLKKPWMLLYLPSVIFLVVSKRLKKSRVIVYLTETNLSEIFVDKMHATTTGTFETIHDHTGFIMYAERRSLEDSEAGKYYKEATMKRFDRGDFAIVFLDNSKQPLSFVFITTQSAVFTPVGLTLPLPENTFGMYDVYTYKDSRGKGYYSFLFEFSLMLMKKKGYNKIWLWLMAHNKASVNVHYKLGLKHIIKILTATVSFGFIKKNVKEVDLDLSELKTLC